MNSSQHSGRGHSPYAMPVGSKAGSFRYRLIRTVKRPFLILFLVVACELTLGHPAIRWQWTGPTYNPKSMSVCICKTVLGEEHTFGGYRTLFTFVREPRFTLSGWFLQKLGLPKAGSH